MSESEMTITQFLTSRGWEYKGQCNCVPRLDKYQNANHPNYELRTNNQQFQIKDISRVTPITITQGNHTAFQATYKRFFNEQ